MKQKTNNNLKSFFYNTDQIGKLLEALKEKRTQITNIRNVIWNMIQTTDRVLPKTCI